MSGPAVKKISKYAPALAESGCSFKFPVPMTLILLNVTLPVLAPPPPIDT
jgi:hypothetical protein